MTLNETLEYMLEYVPSEYDTSPGSFFYDLLYPVAVEICLLRNKITELQKNAFALTATGEYLDRKAAEQGLTRRSATYASGMVRVYGDVGEIVRAGAKFATTDLLFSAAETAAVPEEGFIDVRVTCITMGTKGNVSAGTINRFPVTLPGLSSVTNPDAMSGGYDEESDAELLERYLEKVQRPNTSGNECHYEEWAKEVTGVGNVQVIPLWNGPGTVKVVITDSNNSVASEGLLSLVKSHIEENRPIGANVTVESAAAKEITVSVKLAVSTDAQDDIEAAIESYLNDVSLNKSYVSYARIGAIILSVDYVDDYSNLTINGGAANITLTEGEIPVLKAVNIT